MLNLGYYLYMNEAEQTKDYAAANDIPLENYRNSVSTYAYTFGASDGETINGCYSCDEPEEYVQAHLWDLYVEFIKENIISHGEDPEYNLMYELENGIFTVDKI